MKDEKQKNLILIIHQNTVQKVLLDDKDSLTIGAGKDDEIVYEDLGKAKVSLKVKNRELSVKGKKIDDLVSGYIPENSLQLISRMENLAVMWNKYTGRDSKIFPMPYRGIIYLGRASDNTIQINNDYISGHHLTFLCEEGVVHIEDGYKGKSSTNGTFLNGQKVKKAVLKSGDIIDLLHIRIIFYNSRLFFENVQGSLIINSSSDSADSLKKNTKRLVYHRSPRLREQMPADDIILKKPPTKASKPGSRRGGISSLLGTGAMVGASMAMGVASPALLAARAASLVAPVSNIVMGKGEGKKDRKRYLRDEKIRLEKYEEYIRSQEAVIRLVADKQRDILTSENPAPQIALNMVPELKRALWEREPIDDDFLKVRLGMGYEKLCVEIKAPPENNAYQMEEEETEELIDSIIENNGIVDKIPTRLDMVSYQTIGLTGNREKIVDLVRNLLICLTASHYYNDIRIVGIFDKEERLLWEPIKWLPHNWDQENQSRFLAFDRKAVSSINDTFHDLLQSRIRGEANAYPYYIFLIGSRELTEHLSVMNVLLSNDVRIGATTLFFYKQERMPSVMQRSWLPKQCQYIIDTDTEYGACGYDIAQVNKKVIFTPDEKISLSEFDRYCRTMSAVEVESSAGEMQNLPGSVTFLQGMNAKSVEDLHAWDNWTHHNKGLEGVPIGVTSDGKPFYFDIVEYGPHGLVAGTTGSGKSEFLTSWLLSLAVQFHPNDVSFIIIDYKGGGLADTLEGLPHMVGKITNIGQNIQRSMLSLESELSRRQKLFSECGVNKYGEYVIGYKKGRFSELLPRLLLICDEFAELKAQEPEFMEALVKAARIGRSLGIHLILATQEPNGVVNDQIRSNTKFQICLKVANSASSRAMIGRPDAARTKQPGRAYVRVGEDEIFELVQTYWCGAPYNRKDLNLTREESQVRLVTLDGQRIKMESGETTRFFALEKTELQAISEYLANVAEEHNVQKIKGIWLPELPEVMYHKDLKFAQGFDGETWNGRMPWLTVPVGMYDKPKDQEQGIYSVDFASFGHYAIYGASGTGKTNMLKTILIGLCRWYTPEDVNLYILDFGSWSFKQWEDLPHVGGVALSNEEEKFSKLQIVLRQAIETRKKVFSKYGISNLKTYRESITKKMPAIILAIDNIVPIFEAYPFYEDILTEIAMQGSSFGIYLLYTANSPTGIRFKILQNIRGNICFEMIDKSDYTNIVGRVNPNISISGIHGRGYYRSVSGAVNFHSALYMEGKDENERTANLKKLVSLMKEKWIGERPARIPVMPEKILLSVMQELYTERNRIPVGYSFKTIEPAYLDLTNSCGTLILGKIKSGKSRFLEILARILAFKKDINKIYLIDTPGASLQSVSDLAERYVTCNEAAATEENLKEIIQILIERQEKFTNKETDKTTFQVTTEEPQICILVDDIQVFTDCATDNAWNMLRRIFVNGHKLGAIVIAAGRSSDISVKVNIDPLISKLVAGQNGLAISGNAALYSYYQNHLGLEEKTRELEESEGLLYKNGEVERIKLIQG